MAQRTYRTEDGRDCFDFDVVRLSDNSLQAYIDSQPSYGPRDTGQHPTHRYYEQSSDPARPGRHYICYDKKVYTEKEIYSVMKYWAEETQHYIRTGVPFRQPGH